MINQLATVFIVTVVLSTVEGHVASWKNSNQLHPVHELYVKPSSDGSTGDLYVAATEENGVKTQWLTDQPINFLPSTTPQATIPVAYAAYPTAPATHEESQTTQKRAILNTPSVQYAYALPFASSEGAVTYPYAVPTTTSQSSSSSPEAATIPTCDPKMTMPYSPFQFFYPHLMSAYGNAKSILKEAGMSDEAAGSAIRHASPFWPQSYTYPMYMMIDPSSWAQPQTTPTTSSTSNSPKESSS